MVRLQRNRTLQLAQHQLHLRSGVLLPPDQVVDLLQQIPLLLNVLTLLLNETHLDLFVLLLQGFILTRQFYQIHIQNG